MAGATVYVAYEDLQGEIPAEYLIEALDDDKDGEPDDEAWEKVAAAVAADIDGILSARFTVPFTEPFPPIVTRAARVFALEKCYQRRGAGPDQNPWTRQADALRKVLQAIADGDAPLDPDSGPVITPATAITEDSKLHNTKGNLNL